jgi:hypothetical protein
LFDNDEEEENECAHALLFTHILQEFKDIRANCWVESFLPPGPVYSTPPYLDTPEFAVKAGSAHTLFDSIHRTVIKLCEMLIKVAEQTFTINKYNEEYCNKFMRMFIMFRMNYLIYNPNVPQSVRDLCSEYFIGTLDSRIHRILIFT